MDGGIRSVGRAATRGDLDAVTRCLTSAFFEDPLWGEWTFPDSAKRAGQLYRLMGAWAAAGLRYPWVRMTEGAESVAVWIPPGEPEMTPSEEARFDSLAREIMGPRTDELTALLEMFAEHHPQEPPHYYLSLWGTHRDHAGHGIGAALMRENLARIDSEGAAAYLESTNPVNLDRYERLGFVRRGEFGPERGPVITTMWREARR